MTAPVLVGAAAHPELAPIVAAIVEHPRSQQVEIGPSEIGTPCVRRLGHLLAGTPKQPAPVPWRPTVGTAVHAWIANAFEAFDERLPDSSPRYLMEQRVTVGTIAGRPFGGSADLYDAAEFRVIDWKIVGPSALKKYRTACRIPDDPAQHAAFYQRTDVGPGQTYRVQAQCYGHGFALADMPVDEVAIWMLPSNGELDQAVRWAEPYRPEVAEWAIKRANDVAAVAAAAGWEATLPALPRVEDRCGRFCPFWRAGADVNDPTYCPGSDAYVRGEAERGRRSLATQLAGLIPPGDDLGAFCD